MHKSMGYVIIFVICRSNNMHSYIIHMLFWVAQLIYEFNIRYVTIICNDFS